VTALRATTSFSHHLGATSQARRGMTRAAVLAALALIPEALHGAEDVRAGIGPAPALVVLLLAQAVACTAAESGRRWGARLLLGVAVGWALGALADHPEVFANPSGFRDGWGSTLPVHALVALNVAAAAYALAPSMPRAWDALKTPPAEASAARERDGAVVLDVRSARERSSGDSITGAVATSWREPDPPPGDRPVLVVCSHGGRSLLAARKLRAAGVDARSIEGGMTAYRRAGLPTEGPA
jgi:rhodanese-related sulfurtransferase